MVKYKYESKWRKGVFLPLLSSDNLEQLKKYKYNIIKITEEEWLNVKSVEMNQKTINFAETVKKNGKK